MKVVVGFLLLCVVGSGLQVVYTSEQVRQLHSELQAAQRRQDAQLAEHSRLLLERSVETSYQNVELVAERRLAMVFPETVQQVSR